MSCYAMRSNNPVRSSPFSNVRVVSHPALFPESPISRIGDVGRCVPSQTDDLSYELEIVEIKNRQFCKQFQCKQATWNWS